MSPRALAERKAQLVAQADLDRMRLSAAVLGARRAASPAALLGGGSVVRAFGGQALAFALPLLARRSPLLRYAAFAVAAARAVRRLLAR